MEGKEGWKERKDGRKGRMEGYETNFPPFLSSIRNPSISENQFLSIGSNGKQKPSFSKKLGFSPS